jgi:NAD(P)-dependent dehydrogenase (short-subunit alcohol dehydrogenase family)
MTFSNKVVLITGGASGIGKASAHAFAHEGAQVVLADMNAEGAQAVAQAITDAGGQAHALHADVGDSASVQAMIAGAVARFGGLHYAVNSAGISGTMMNAITDTEDDVFDRVMRVNVRGVWLCMKHQIPAMVASGGGAIVNLASVAGLIGAPGGSAYTASKHAVIGMTRAVALETARQNVRVNAVCPSYIDTPMVTDITTVNDKMAQRVQKASPMHRLGTPEEVASAILYLCSDGATFINGAVLAIDGGLTAS